MASPSSKPEDYNFHDFPEGLTGGTLMIINLFFQMVKMKMNFFGLHTYRKEALDLNPLYGSD